MLWITRTPPESLHMCNWHTYSRQLYKPVQLSIVANISYISNNFSKVFCYEETFLADVFWIIFGLQLRSVCNLQVCL